MSARDFLVRGLLAGLVAGIATFVVAFTVGESHVQDAIDIEESGHAAAAIEGGHLGQSAVVVPAHGDDHGTTEVSRGNQRTWGLLTGTLTVGIALGGIVALVAAGVAGRLGRLRLTQSTALVAVVGWVAVELVPFLKYPANPPAVGNADTIGERTGLYFAYMAISVAAAVASVWLANRLAASRSTYVGVVAGLALFLVVVVVAGQLMPTVNEVGDFPADVLWYFRRASLITQATLWGVLGVVLTGLLGRLQAKQLTEHARRELAASL